MSTLKKSTLQAMLDDVANDFVQAVELKKNELRKDAPPPAAEEESESKPAPGDSPSASPSPEDSSASASAPAPDMGAAPDAGMGDPAADQALDPAALQAEYAKLSPEELDMHLQAAMAAKQAIAGPAAPGMDAGAPPAPAPVAPPAPGPDMAMKSELKATGEALNKASSELAEVKALVQAQADEIATLQAAIQKAVDSTPMRKSLSASDYTRKPTTEAKEWNKESIHSHLKQLTASGALKKSDRDLVNDFYCGVIKIDKLAHLFEEK